MLALVIPTVPIFEPSYGPQSAVLNNCWLQASLKKEGRKHLQLLLILQSKVEMKTFEATEKRTWNKDPFAFNSIPYGSSKTMFSAKSFPSLPSLCHWLRSLSMLQHNSLLSLVSVLLTFSVYVMFKLPEWGTIHCINHCFFSSFFPQGLEHHLSQLVDFCAVDLVMCSLDDSQQKKICYDQFPFHGCLCKSIAGITVYMEFWTSRN